MKKKEKIEDYGYKLNVKFSKPFQKKRVAKPRDFHMNHLECWVLYDVIALYYERLGPKQARKLANWLLKAADYLEQKEENHE